MKYKDCDLGSEDDVLRLPRPVKILFVQLDLSHEFMDVTVKARSYNDGIYYIASFVQRNLPDVEVEFCQMEWGEDPKDYPLESYDYIMVSCLATMFYSSLWALDEIQKRKSPSCKVIFGGPHPSFAPYEALRYGDFAILGEGEVPALQLVYTLEHEGDLDEVDNLCYVGGDGRLVINQKVNYGGIPNMINPELFASDKQGRVEWATMSMSRGCPFNCSFCYSIRILGRQFRPKSVSMIREELQGIYNALGSRRFYVTDINFTTRKDFCHQVADAVRDLGYKYTSMSRIELADDPELMRDLKDAGFSEYFIGVESEQPEALKIWNKKCDISLQTERLQRIAEEDIYLQTGIIFGLDFQTERVMDDTARWCAEARLTNPVFLCQAEYPFQNMLFGSRQDIEDHRIIMGGQTYQHYSYVGIFPRHLRPSTLQRKMLEAYDIFYEKASEMETRPQRRMRLKHHIRCAGPGVSGMKQHIANLEKLEKPYYTAKDELKEDLLKADFESQHGELRDWLANADYRGEHPERLVQLSS